MPFTKFICLFFKPVMFEICHLPKMDLANILWCLWKLFSTLMTFELFPSNCISSDANCVGTISTEIALGVLCRQNVCHTLHNKAKARDVACRNSPNCGVRPYAFAASRSLFGQTPRNLRVLFYRVKRARWSPKPWRAGHMSLSPALVRF